MYDITNLLEKDRETKSYFKNHFLEFFRNFDYGVLCSGIEFVVINTHADLSRVRRGVGLYLVLSDYQDGHNPCTLKVNDLKVIYRGHGVRIRKRVESHIFNAQYNQDRDGTTYGVCMKLDGNNGINIDKTPYSEYTWAVIYHPMTNSTKTMREQAEQAFDEVYSMPIGSNA